MKSLCQDVLRYLLLYVNDTDRIQLLSCSSLYSGLRKSVRKVLLKEANLKRCCEDDSYLAKVLSVVEHSGTQVEISYLEDSFLFELFPFTQLSSFSTRSVPLLSQIFSLNTSLRFKTLEFQSKPPLSQFDMDTLANICEFGMIETLKLWLKDFWDQSITVPYFRAVKSLIVTGGVKFDRKIRNITLPILYSQQLQELQITNCLGIDVSCLDYIPNLAIELCSKIRGISNLKNNKRIRIYSVVIDENEDISGAFTYSEDIAVYVVKENTPVKLDLSKWQKVKRLEIYCDNNIYFVCNTLPSTVRRCNLSGYSVEAINWQPFTHQLSELILHHSAYIKSLIGLRLDVIPVLEFASLGHLVSLEGLGGRNQKVTVKCCPKIEDFSAVRSVDTVIIEDCDRFKDIRQVNEVRALELNYIEGARNLDSLNEKTQYLTIAPEKLTISSYSLLSKIPHLTLSFPFLGEVTDFLANGGKFENQTITFKTFDLNNCIERLKDFSSFQFYWSGTMIVNAELGIKAIRFIRKPSTI